MHQIQKYIIQNVEKYPKDIITHAMSEFGVTRAAVYFHMEKLKSQGIMRQEGARRGSSYSLISKDFVELSKDGDVTVFTYKVGEKGEDVLWKEDIEPLLINEKENVRNIFNYGFSEMFNNVLDHSKSEKANVEVNIAADKILVVIQDFGIGAFRSVQQAFHLTDMRDAVLKLHQGKITTDEERHTGQGIFFTSRAVDEFILTANGVRYYKNNSEDDDWYLESIETEAGTKVELCLSRSSSRTIQEVFNEYTDLENFEFNKSHLRISLSKYKEDKFVSRSQAKRLFIGIKGFTNLVLDFKGIKIVGQAFADEVFGVFGLAHPEIKFQIINANDDILFMVKKALMDRKFPTERVQIL